MAARQEQCSICGDWGKSSFKSGFCQFEAINPSSRVIEILNYWWKPKTTPKPTLSIWSRQEYMFTLMNHQEWSNVWTDANIIGENPWAAGGQLGRRGMDFDRRWDGKVSFFVEYQQYCFECSRCLEVLSFLKSHFNLTTRLDAASTIPAPYPYEMINRLNKGRRRLWQRFYTSNITVSFECQKYLILSGW